MAAIVRIGEIAFDLGNPAVGAGMEDVSTDRRQIGIKAQDEFARRVDPLPRDRSNQPQQYRLVFEQTPETAGFHFGDELIVARCAAVLLRLRCIGRRRAGLPRLDEALVDCRSGKAGQLLEKRKAQACASGFVQVVGRPCVDTRPKQRLGLFDHRREQMFERTRLGSAQAPQSVWRFWSGFATPPRSRLRRRSTPASRRKLCGERWQISPAPDRSSIRRDPAAGQTATSRRWHTTGTRRRGAARPDRHRLSGQATVRNHRTGVRRWLRRERSSARKKHPYEFFPLWFLNLFPGRGHSMSGEPNVISRPGCFRPEPTLAVPGRLAFVADIWGRIRRVFLASQALNNKGEPGRCTGRTGDSKIEEIGGFIYINQPSVTLTVLRG